MLLNNMLLTIATSQGVFQTPIVGKNIKKYINENMCFISPVNLSTKINTFEGNNMEYDEKNNTIMLSPAYIANINRLNGFSTLRLGDEGLVVSKAQIDVVKNMLFKIKNQPEIFPTIDGRIQLEYETDKKYLEFEFITDKDVNIFSIDSDGKEKNELVKNINSNFYEIINKKVNDFCKEI